MSLLRRTRDLPSVAQYLTFTVADVAFAVDARHARHVMSADDVGEIRYYGEAYPVVDLRRLLGSGAADDGGGYIVLVDCGTKAALHVDALRGLRHLDADALAPLPAVYRGPERRWIAGLAVDGDAVTVVLQLDALLGAAS